MFAVTKYIKYPPFAVKTTPRKAIDSQNSCLRLSLVLLMTLSKKVVKISEVDWIVRATGRGRKKSDQVYPKPLTIMMIFLIACHLKLKLELKVRSIPCFSPRK